MFARIDAYTRTGVGPSVHADGEKNRERFDGREQQAPTRHRHPGVRRALGTR